MEVDDSSPESQVECSSISGNEQLKNQLLDRVAQSNAHFKNQQRGEKDLTYEEKKLIAGNILQHSVPVFLQRFGKHLALEDLAFFEPFRQDYEINFHVEELTRRGDHKTSAVHVKNRRYEALQKLVSEGKYFQDKEMRHRNPLLFEQMVGQYLNQEERADMMKSNEKNVTFSSFLMDQIERAQEEYHLQQQLDQEQDQYEEFDSDDDDNDVDCINAFDGSQIALTQAEKEILRSEFRNLMYESFLSGKDDDFDYSTVDDNVEYDCLTMRQQDEEERYFDSEEPETVHT